MEHKSRKTAKAKPAKKARPAKSKLTLSVAPKYVAMLRRASARKGRSITELVEELAVTLDKEPAFGEKGKAYLERNLGVLVGKVKPEDWDRNDRVGDILRKHAPR
jgi:hypothetical protein